MSARSISGDKWDEVVNHEWFIAEPSWEDLDHALRRLDSKAYTIVTIRGTGDQHMAIGGGSGRYVVYATSDNYEFWNLLGSQPGDAVVVLNAGGQDGEYPAKLVVDLEKARAAARTFLLNLQLDASLRWERQ